MSKTPILAIRLPKDYVIDSELECVPIKLNKGVELKHTHKPPTLDNVFVGKIPYKEYFDNIEYYGPLIKNGIA